MAFEAVDPLDTLPWPTAHFQNMGHRMRGPDISWIAFDSLPTYAFRRSIVAGFLQTEGVAAEEKAVCGHARVPGRQRARHNFVHPVAFASIEAAILRQLEGQHVAGIFGGNRFPTRRGASEVAGDPGGKRRHMSGFARRHPDRLRRSLRRFERTLCARHHRPLSEQHHEIAA